MSYPVMSINKARVIRVKRRIDAQGLGNRQWSLKRADGKEEGRSGQNLQEQGPVPEMACSEPRKM